MQIKNKIIMGMVVLASGAGVIFGSVGAASAAVPAGKVHGSLAVPAGKVHGSFAPAGKVHGSLFIFEGRKLYVGNIAGGGVLPAVSEGTKAFSAAVSEGTKA